MFNQLLIIWYTCLFSCNGYQGSTYYMPSAFSPGNRDGRIDVFRPTPADITETYFFNVFNRSGQLVYTT